MSEFGAGFPLALSISERSSDRSASGLGSPPQPSAMDTSLDASMETDRPLRSDNSRGLRSRPTVSAMLTPRPSTPRPARHRADVSATASSAAASVVVPPGAGRGPAAPLPGMAPIVPASPPAAVVVAPALPLPDPSLSPSPLALTRLSSTAGGPLDVVRLDKTMHPESDLQAMISAASRRKALFVLPHGFSTLPTPRTPSALYLCGHLTTNDQHHRTFHCMLGNCEMAIRISGTTTPGLKHIALHGITSIRAVEGRKRKGEFDDAANDELVLREEMGDGNYFLIKYTLLVVNHNLPFSFIEAPDARLFFSSVSGFPSRLCSESVQRTIVSLYNHAAETVKLEIAQALASSPAKQFHLLVDKWSAKTSGDSYIGVHIFFVDPNSDLQSRLLACQLYVSDGGSAAMATWIEELLADFGLPPSKILSATTDGGSDVRACCGRLLSGMWEHCTSYWLSLLMHEVFGNSSLDCGHSLIARVKDLISFFNQSYPSHLKLEREMLNDMEDTVGLRRDVPQRWMSTVKLLERLLYIWVPLRAAFLDLIKTNARLQQRYPEAVDTDVFPLDADRTSIMELYSLMSLVGDVIVAAQNSTAPMGPDVLMKLCTLMHMLQPVNKLPIINPGLQYANKDASRLLTSRPHVGPGGLQPVTRCAREKLLERIIARFLPGYSADEARMFDLCAFLYPPMKQLPHLEMVFFKADLVRAGEIRSRTEAKIKSMAIEVARHQLHVSPPAQHVPLAVPQFVVPATVTRVPQQAIFPSAAATAAATAAVTAAAANADLNQAPPAHQLLPPSEHFLFATGGAGPSPSAPHVSAEMLVETEMNMYRAVGVISNIQLAPCDVLKFWQQNARTFPILSTVARAVLGFQASAGTIERDFSVSGGILTSQRARMSSAYLQMMLFLKVNKQVVEAMHLPDATLLTQREVDEHWPFRFTRIRMRKSLLLSNPIEAARAAARRAERAATARAAGNPAPAADEADSGDEQ